MSDKKGFVVNQWLEIIAKSTVELLASLTSNGQIAYNSTLGKLIGRTNNTNDPIVQEALAATLTNKTIDADANSISNIDDGNIKVGAAVDATKIADGSVSNTEFQYINTLSANAQDQLDAVATDAVQVLTNKTIDGDDNTVQDLALTSLKTNLADANKFLVRDGAGVVISNTKTVPTSDVVGISDAQVLTNKDIDTGTASNTSRITIGKNSKTNLDGLTRKEATLVYGTDTQQMYVDNGVSLTAVGGSWTTVAEQNISANGTITISETIGLQYLRISGDGASVTANVAPFGSAEPADGTVARLVGQSNTETVTLLNNDASKGLILNGDCTLGFGDSLTVQYDLTIDRWIEQARNN